MTSTAFTLPGTAGVLSGPGDDIVWNNINNIKLADGSYADSGGMFEADTTQIALGTNFGFSIPAGATINGITVQVFCYTDRLFDGNPETMLIGLSLYNGGVAIGNLKQDANGIVGGGSGSLFTAGSSSDKWGATLTAAIVNGATFGVGAYAQDGGSSDNDPIHAYIDYIKMQVTYSLGLGNKSILLLGVG